MRARDEPVDSSPALLPVLVVIGMVIAVISSLGAPLLTTIAEVDHVSLSASEWALTITLLVGAVATPVLGRLGDGPARRPVILTVLAVVAAGSGLGALPVRSFVLLLLGRGMQGVGMGLLPLILAVARDSLPPERCVRAIGLLSVSVGAGVGLGYPIAGLLDDRGGLHATFWFGVVVAVVALALSAPVLPRAARISRPTLDTTGAALLALVLTALLVAMTQGQPWGWASPRVVGLLVVGAALVVPWVIRERSVETPLVELRLLRHPGVAVANSAVLLINASMYMFFPMLVDFAQTPPSAGYGFNASVAMAGLMLLPFSALSVATSRVAAALDSRLGSEGVLPIGALLIVMSSVLFIFAGDALWEGFLAMGIAGLGVGFCFAAMPALIVRSVPVNETGSALGFYQVMAYVGASVGSGISATVLSAYTAPGNRFPKRMGFTITIAIAALTAVIVAAGSASLARHVASSRPNAHKVEQSDAATASF